jgi:5'-3' exonuclease
MGVKSGFKTLPEELNHISNFGGERFGVDAYGLVFRFGTNFFKSKKDNKNNQTNLINYIICEFINLIHKFKYNGITLVFVFDGKPITEKKQPLKRKRQIATEELSKLVNEEDKETKSEESKSEESENEEISLEEIKKKDAKLCKLSKKSFTITPELIDSLKCLLDDLDCLYFHEKNVEGDQLLALLCKLNIIDIVFSQDFDMFVYSDVKFVINNLDFLENTVCFYDKLKILNTYNITVEQLIDAVFIKGTPYNCGFYKVSLEDSINYIKEFKTFYNFIDCIDIINLSKPTRQKLIVPSYNFDYNLVKTLFTLTNKEVNNNNLIKSIELTYADFNENQYNLKSQLDKKKIVSQLYALLEKLKLHFNSDYNSIKKYTDKLSHYVNLHFGIII